MKEYEFMGAPYERLDEQMNDVQVTHLKDGKKMFHINVSDDISVDELKKLVIQAEKDYQDTLTNGSPPYALSDSIEEDKIYTFEMTGEALKDIMSMMNNERNAGRKYGRARIYGNKVVISAAIFTATGEVLALPHAMTLPFKVK